MRINVCFIRTGPFGSKWTLMRRGRSPPDQKNLGSFPPFSVFTRAARRNKPIHPRINMVKNKAWFSGPVTVCLYIDECERCDSEQQNRPTKPCFYKAIRVEKGQTDRAKPDPLLLLWFLRRFVHLSSEKCEQEFKHWIYMAERVFERGIMVPNRLECSPTNIICIYDNVHKAHINNIVILFIWDWAPLIPLASARSTTRFIYLALAVVYLVLLLRDIDWLCKIV